MRSAPWPVRSRTRWRANRNRADAGHDLAFGQVAVAHQPSAAFFGARLGVAIKERGYLRLDRPRQQGPGAAAQHLGQRIGKRRWLGKLQNGIVTHGVSLLRWRSGGSITPTIRRLNPSPRHQLLAIARNVIESLSAVIGFHLHRPTEIPRVAGVSVMLAEREPRGIREIKARAGRSVGKACHRRSRGYGRL